MRSELYHKLRLEDKKSEILRHPRSEQRLLKYKILRVIRDTVKLAVPVVLSRVGMVAMSMCDTIYVGHYSTTELGFQSIANTVHVLLLSIAMALMQGTIILTANSFGQGKYRDCGQVLRRSIPYALKISVVLMILSLPAEFVMKLIGQEPELAHGSARVLQVYAIGIPFAMFAFALTSYLEGTKRPVPGMVLTILANLINIGTDYIFVFGHGAFPAMGAVGSAISTTLIRVILAIGLFIIVFCIDDTDEFGVWVKPKKDKEASKELRKLGYGASLAVGVEEGSYAFLNIMAGWLGTIPLAAFTIMSSVSTNIYVLAGGIGTASSVLTGISMGKKSKLYLKISGWSGLGFNLIVMILSAIVLLICPKLITSIYTSDPELIEACVVLIKWCSLIAIVDGTQQVCVNILRGMLDIVIPTVIQAVSFILIMMPLVWLIVFKFDNGILGMVWSMIYASTFSSIALVYRFARMCKKVNFED
ncbi:MAG: MATE family efflux transporter [Alphaproteobacteria bacterium]|nr:MATE family efflux transporter [Alphaproteobacteria bacterium]